MTPVRFCLTSMHAGVGGVTEAEQMLHLGLVGRAIGEANRRLVALRGI